MTESELNADPNNLKTVNPCCCCPMSYKEFYEFINISDIVGCIIGLIIAFILFLFDFSVSLILTCLTVIWLIISIIAFCIYRPRKNYRKGFHKFYVIFRMVMSALDIVLTVSLLQFVLYGDLHELIEPFRVLLVVLVFLFLIMSIFNLYWSYLFFVVVFSDSGVKNKDFDNESEITEDPQRGPSANIDEENGNHQTPMVS